MKTFIILAACVVAALAAVPSEQEIQAHWEEFKTTHAKTYASPVEEAYRAKVFKENALRIAKHNERFDRGEVTFKVGYNQYADMHTHEITEKMNGYRMGQKKPSNNTVFKAHLNRPSSEKVDWRSKGFVTPVKDQGGCGACWAFSTTGALEGQHFKKTGKLVSLSEQNLVDCSTANYGCGGGLMDDAFEYVRVNGGLDTEESYPYTGEDGNTCFFNSEDKIDLQTSGYVDIDSTEKDLEAAVSEIGPISVAIDASHFSFQFYKSGIYYEPKCSSKALDHGVLAVGYGTEWPNKQYWIVKNSWGPKWGEDGYIRIARNKRNHCGIATMASYPTILGL
ncbi:Cathepsin L [Frankliniella fusca]|uniref:Cathepsin L n=1 Tax=Frankliniella fusca TaxID=407009 RepID=A0AAE1LTK5_9NEOP|nr:Cathepsin L [Frankliniella fusca]KAK3929873.1 Cathepsin L [Frankliniella fusca]